MSAPHQTYTPELARRFGKRERIASAERELQIMRAKKYPAWRIDRAEQDLAALRLSA